MIEIHKVDAGKVGQMEERYPNAFLLMEDFSSYIFDMSQLLLPVIITIYIFSYREQKELAYSLLKRGISCLNICFSVITSFFIVINIIPIDFFPWNLVITKFIINLIWVTFVIFFIVIISSKFNAIKVFKRNNKLIKKSFKSVNLFLAKEKVSKFRAFLLNKKLWKIKLSSEICFQNIISKDKYILRNDFSNSLKYLDDSLLQEVANINQSAKKFTRIVYLSRGDYLQINQIILSNLIEILDISVEVNKKQEINLLIDAFMDLLPNEFLIDILLKENPKLTEEDKDCLEKSFKKYYDGYYYALFQFLLKLNREENIYISDILSRLKNREFNKKQYFSENDLLTLKTGLFLQAIQSNNIKLLTDISNSYMNFLHQFDIQLDTTKQLKNKGINLDKIKDKADEMYRKDADKHNATKLKVLRVFLLGIIKSVELGNYSCAGFLVKNTNENFSIKDIENTANEIWENIGDTKPRLGLSRKLTKNLSVIFQYSKVSYEYCFQKSMLLIYFQNTYSVKIQRKENKEVFNVRRFIEKDGDYNYIFEKLKGLEGVYGMISLERENINLLENKVEQSMTELVHSFYSTTRSILSFCKR